LVPTVSWHYLCMKGVKYMKCNITGRNLEITESIKTAVEEKITKLGRYFAPDVVAQVTLSMEKSRQKVEITIPVKGDVIRAESENTDMYVSIDLAVRAIEVQLKKYRKKIIDRYQTAGIDFAQEYWDADDGNEEEPEVKIVKRKHFAFKPMDPEEACMQMDLLGHDFFVFTNAETDQTNVVYKRKNDTYGIIEPEF